MSMMAIDGAASNVVFSVTNYLSTNQQATYKNLNPHLKKILNRSFLDSDTSEDCDIARLILDIVRSDPQNTQSGIGLTFFQTILTNPADDLLPSLKKLFAIVENHLSESFFKCAVTQKNEYYSSTSLVEIIQMFHKLLPHLPKPCPPLTHCLPYDQGGKELLQSILKSPKQLISLLKSETKAANTQSSLQPKAPEPFKELITKNYDFNQMKSAAIRYLTSLNENQRLGIQIYLDVFRSLQDNAKYKKITSLEKAQVIALILAVTTDDAKPISSKYTVDDLHELLIEAQEIHEHCGEEILIYFCSAPVMLSRPPFNAVLIALRHLKVCYKELELIEQLDTLMAAFSKGQMSVEAFSKNLESLCPSKKNIEATDTIATTVLFNRFTGATKDPNVSFPLSLDHLNKIKEQYAIVQKYCKEWNQCHMSELANQASIVSAKVQKSAASEEDILKLVAIGRLAILIKFRMYLYNTQVWTVLAELNHPNGAIAQVKTGEGKSMIVTLLAFVLSMTRKSQGHIISSAHNLSSRDQQHYSDFFKAFGIQTSHICHHQPEADRFQGRILYGTATDFEFALMREMLYFSKLFPDAPPPKPNDKRFDWVVIDEIDNLTIDTAQNSARLSSPAEINYDWVYAPILNFVKENLNPKVPLVNKSNQVDALRTFLKQYMNGQFASIVGHLSDQKLEIWISSAQHALFVLNEKEDYVIGLRDSRGGDKVKGILIVDVNNTAKIMHGSRWSSGIHEFVEVKHNLEVERESICPISISHPVFYRIYREMYGITGTIGSKHEREELKAIYNIPSFDVPTHNPPQRDDSAPTKLCETHEEYVESILQIISATITNSRPILVLCETIKSSEALENVLKARNIPYEMLNEVQKKTEKEIIEKAGLPGIVTIATNTAGRGTDIKLSEKSLANGGLHVLITFYPDSERVEFQARGRAGRQGQPGSSQIILSKEKLIQDNNDFKGLSSSKILEALFEKRQKKAVIQKDTHISYADIERYAFEFVHKFYQQLNYFTRLSEEEHFLETLGDFFNDRKLKSSTPRDFSKLSPKKRQLALAVIKLLENSSDCTMAWKVLITQVAKRVRDETINIFTLEFYSKITEIVHESGVTSLLTRKAMFAESFKKLSHLNPALQTLIDDFDNAVKAASKNQILNVEERIQKLYEETEEKWLNFLDPSGSGIVAYVSDITEVDLSPLKSDTHLAPILRGLQRKGRSSVRLDSDFDCDALNYNLGNFKKMKTSADDTTSNDDNSSDGNGENASTIYSDKDISLDFPPLYHETYKKSLFDGVDLNIPIPAFQPGTQIPIPPQDGLKIGLKNFGQTCGINSIIKFIACTTFYDQMLVDPVPADREKLQGLLRMIVFSLRNGTAISDNLLLAFLYEVNHTLQGIQIGAQNDAPEFLFQLIQNLQWKPAHLTDAEAIKVHKKGMFPRQGISYKTAEQIPDGWGKYGSVEKNVLTQLDITIPEYYAGKILDLPTLIKDIGVRNLRPDKLIATAQGAAKEVKFTATTHLLNLPPTIMIYVKRFLSDANGANRKKIDSAIKLENDSIPFTRHQATIQTINNSLCITKITQAETRYYRIGAAVVHMGTTDNGHYVCLERASNGALIEHNDEITRATSPNDFGSLGYFLRLDLV